MRFVSLQTTSSNGYLLRCDRPGRTREVGFRAKEANRASEPRAVSRVGLLRSRFTGQRNCSITGSKVFDRFQTCFSGTVFDHWVEIPVAAGSWSPHMSKGPKRRYLEEQKKTASQPQVLEMQQ